MVTDFSDIWVLGLHSGEHAIRSWFRSRTSRVKLVQLGFWGSYPEKVKLKLAYVLAECMAGFLTSSRLVPYGTTQVHRQSRKNWS